jgi:hypothetical protein
MVSMASRSHRRMSVATWSLRLRPVCRRLPASPTRAVRRFFDVEVDVLVVEVPVELAARDFAADLRHAAFDVGEIGLADDALAGQHPGVGQRTADILGSHAVVEEHAGGVAFDEFGDGFGEAAGPGLGGAVLRRGLICHN